MSISQKQKALTEQSVAFSNDFMVSLYEKVMKGSDVGYSYKINGREISIQPERLFQMLQVMRLPEFAGSKLSINAFVSNKHIRSNLRKYYDVTKAKIQQLDINDKERRRIVSQIPVKDIPATKNVVIVVSESKSPKTIYSEFVDEKGQYMTIGKFLETELSKDATYLISANFFARSINNPEMEKFLDKAQSAKNIYPV